MDIKQAEMQFLGFFGVFQEAFKLISSRKRIFTQIAFAFLLLPSLILMTYEMVTDNLKDSIRRDRYHQRYAYWHQYQALARPISTKKAVLKAHDFVSLFVLLVSYPLATLVITCCVACVYAGGETIFKKLIRVVPKICKRVAFTSLYAYLIIFFSFSITSIVHRLDFRFPFSELETFLDHALEDLVFMGLGYMIISSQMALVVSVLEKDSGVDAITKGMRLVQGKKWTVLLRLAALYFPVRVVYAIFDDQVVDSYEHWRTNIVVKILYGAAMMMLFIALVVFGLVVQAVTYYVCKSTNGESVDVLTLLDDLEVYREEPAPEGKAPPKQEEETENEQTVDHV